MYKTILVPVDGSEGSNRAVDYCIDFVKKIPAERILLLHVTSIPGRVQSISGKLGSMFFTMKEKLAEYGNEVLADAKNKIMEQIDNVTVETRLVFGHAANSIVDEAHRENCDVIIIGSRGLSGLEGKLIGTVSNYVAQHAKCTVTIVKKKRD